jgi:hypothetical protein
MKMMNFESTVRIVNLLGLASLLLLLDACTSMSAQFAPSLPNQQFSQRTSVDKIELFRSQTPNKPYTEIGVVNSCCSADTNELIDLLKLKASQSGGDAILGLDVQAVGGASASVVRYQTP